MKKQYYLTIGMISYVLAILIILHWIFISTFDEFIHLHKRGFSNNTLQSLPDWLKPLYGGVPNLISLICFMLFTFSAFLFVKEKQKTYFYISVSSFVMILWLFIFLLK